ncbi:VOC family protein [Leifsonia sp. AG29]|uniref:VOC family protein n=1 Tax=Leifsonia sp. AG29 TaxID=2598860 RepID=UPI00131EB224|nr:VOC family protein [Leifsonia sp. AG29]
MGNPIAMVEIISRDHERAQRFYSELFGWNAEADPAMGGYALVDTVSEPIQVSGGIGPSMDGTDTGVKFYVRVDDLAATLDRAVALGGSRIAEPAELPEGYGSFAVAGDPDGNPVGLWA